MLATEIIRSKRDGGALTPAQIEAFVQGLTCDSSGHGAWSEGQIAALAMAVLLRGMGADECVALTRAMTASGEVLQWQGAGLHGPILDKHSTGGVGDKVSLLLAPIVAACGGVVPMISGRGLGHTGGTLDKLQALPGYVIEPPRAQLLQVLRDAGCAIVGANQRLAPADKRLYAVRDISATIESIPLITASILSKKLAAGLQGLVLDVKVGNGAFMRDLGQARALATSLVQVATGACLPAAVLISDMNQVLGHTAGNALEVQEAIDFLTDRASALAAGGAAREPRLLELTLALSARLLQLGGLAADAASGQAMAQHALSSGAAAEAFARMVAGLGGPHDVLAAGGAQLPNASVKQPLVAARDGVLAAMDTRALGLAVLALGGGRQRASDAINPTVGISQVLPLGQWVRAGQVLLMVHAASEDDAHTALQAARATIDLADVPGPAQPLIHALVDPG